MRCVLRFVFLLVWTWLCSAMTKNPCETSYITEKTFDAIVAILFNYHLVPNGDILDVGAHKGDTACFYACLAPHRKVHAVDPNVNLVNKYECAHPLFTPHNYAVADKEGMLDASFDKSGFITKLTPAVGSGNVEMTTLDSLFLMKWKSIPGFLHIDVEGHELEVLQGGSNVVSKYHPVLTVEARVMKDKELVIKLFTFIEKLDYSLYMVNEVCGATVSCRNFIALPPNSRARHNPGLTVAIRGNLLVAVNKANVFDQYTKYAQFATNWTDSRQFV